MAIFFAYMDFFLYLCRLICVNYKSMPVRKDINVAAVEPEEEYSGTITQPFDPSEISLTTPPMNLGDLIEMIKAGWINFGTNYQRSENLWSDKQQSRLIESILLGLRLPAFYFEEVNKRQWNIIDGLQRCCAIRNFCQDQTLKLHDLEFLSEQFDGATFDKLDFATQREIKMLPITVNLLAKGVPDMVKYVLFKRLNTGGVSLTAQEIRNAVYAGPIISFIREMARSRAFTEATLNKVETRRKTDMDFVSRFVAFYLLGWENYRPDLDRFINEAMEKLKNLDDCEYVMKRMQEDFEDVLLLSMRIFGNRAFRKQTSADQRRKPLNKAYFEVITVTLARLTVSERGQLYERKTLLQENMMKAMKESQRYRDSFSGGTAEPSSVKMRFTWMNDIVQYTLMNKKIAVYDNKLTSEEF